MYLDWLHSFWGSFAVLVLTAVLLPVCHYGCQVYHALMADNEDTQHILLNISYQQYAYCLQIGGFLHAAKVQMIRYG